MIRYPQIKNKVETYNDLVKVPITVVRDGHAGRGYKPCSKYTSILLNPESDCAYFKVLGLL